MALAQISDVEASLLRSLTTPESQHVGALLERAERILTTRIPDLLDQATADASFRDLVVAVESEAVARVFRNPEGLRQESEGNYMYTVNAAVASGLLTILRDEWQRLGVSPIGSIAPATDGYARARGWIS